MRERESAARNLLINLDNAEADGVSEVVPFADPPLADDDLDSVRANDYNVDAVIGDNLHHHLAPDHHVDAAVVVVPRPVVE